MRPLRARLNAKIPWLQLLGLLDVRVDSTALPAVVGCPVCSKEELNVLPDHLGGEWFACDNCQTTGDAIELAAATWRLNLVESIQLLSRSGFDLPTAQDTVQSYLRQQVEPRKRLLKLWNESRGSYLYDSTDARRLVHDLNFHSELLRARWEQGPGQLLGGAASRRVRSAFYPRTAEKGGSNTQVFRGRGWTDVLLLPYWDMPGRISGFFMIGRDGDEDSQLFRAAKIGNEHTEAGLHFHPEVWSVANRRWDRHVVAVKNPMLAIQLQARHFELSGLPLPLVAWRSVPSNSGGFAKTQYAWRMAARHRVVFWMPELDFATLRQAAAVDGLVGVQGPNPATDAMLQAYVRSQMPEQLVRRLVKSAKPWVEIFAAAIEQLPDILVEELARQVTKTTDELVHILRDLPEGPRERLESVLSRTDAAVTVPYRKETIVEEHGRWAVTSPRRTGAEIILHGILRVDEVIYHPRTEKSYLKGRLLADGKVVPFCADEKKIKENTLGWISELARKEGRMLVEGQQTWSRQLLEIAYAIHQPKYVTGADIVGWDGDGAKFVLPDFEIRIGGKIVPTASGLVAENAPGLNLAEPEALLPADFEAAEKELKAGPLFWACVAPIMANILAPAFAHNPSGIVLVGGAAGWAGCELSRAMGCEQAAANAGGISADTERLYKREFVHRWPLFVGDSLARCWGKWWSYWANQDQHGFRNCVVVLQELPGMAKAVGKGWHVVSAGTGSKMSPSWRVLANKLVPAYLQDLAKRDFRLHPAETNETWLDEVLHDLACFTEQRGGNKESVLKARSCLWPDTDDGHADAFACVLGDLVRTKKVVVRPSGFEPRNNKPCLSRIDPGRLLIPDEPLRNMLTGLHLLLPASDCIAAGLQKAGVLLDESDDGWLVEEAWWLEKNRSRARLLHL